jgi:hypothetical protein
MPLGEFWPKDAAGHINANVQSRKIARMLYLEINNLVVD